MPRRKPVTAEEVMAKLDADPDWVAKRITREREHKAREQECAADEAAIVQEIRMLGYDIDSVWDLVNNAPHAVLKRRFTGAYSQAYPILVRHLDIEHRNETREGIIRALTVNDGGPEVEAGLLRHLQSETDDKLKWTLANALQTAMPVDRRKNYPEIKTTLKPNS